MNLFAIAEDLYTKACDKKITPTDLQTIIDWQLSELPVLFGAADMLRRKFRGNQVTPCTLMNIKSGACSEDCAFCSQSIHHATEVAVTPLAQPFEIIARYADKQKSAKEFCIVSSGRRLTDSQIDSIIEAVAGCNGPVHASLGILPTGALERLRDAGVVCYNHNLETGPAYFSKIVTTHTFAERVNTVRSAKEAGLSVCCGGIFGMGESWNDRLDLIVQLKELDVDTVPINFLVPVPGTAIKTNPLSPLECLKIISLIRFALPDKIIKVCGGREYALKSLVPMIFYAGADGYVSDGYLTTAGRSAVQDDQMLADLGLIR